MKINEYIQSKFIEDKIVTQEQASEVMKECETRQATFFNVVVDKKFATEIVVYKELAKLFNLDFLELVNSNLTDSLLMKVDNGFISETRIIPFKLENGILIVCIDSPFNTANCNLIRRYIDAEVEPVLITKENMDRLLGYILNKDRRLKAVEDMGIEVDKNQKKLAAKKDEFKLDDYMDAPAVQLADSLLNEAVSMGASDIHIEPMESIVRVRFRVDGMLIEHCTINTKLYGAVCARYKIMAELDISERRIPQDGKISLIINENLYDFRISTLPIIYGEKIVIRIYNALGDEIKVANLTKNKKYEALMRKMIESPHGIILLTGPTGSGKTTTLYSFLKELNTTEVNITTIEDPVENQIAGINQIQVNTKTNLTFATALRSILRQDPNVIMVGEIRDEETAHIAVQAAITGHLVLSTIHTNDAVTTITRLVDMGVEPYLVADSLIGAISQRLVRKLCPHCKTVHTVTREEAIELNCAEGTQIYEPKGCGFCNNTGYSGRTAVFEILPIDDEIKTAIDQKISEFTIEKVKDVVVSKGLDTLKTSCREVVLDGVTSMAEYFKLMEFNEHTNK